MQYLQTKPGQLILRGVALSLALSLALIGPADAPAQGPFRPQLPTPRPTPPPTPAPRTAPAPNLLPAPGQVPAQVPSGLIFQPQVPTGPLSGGPSGYNPQNQPSGYGQFGGGALGGLGALGGYPGNSNRINQTTPANNFGPHPDGLIGTWRMYGSPDNLVDMTLNRDGTWRVTGPPKWTLLQPEGTIAGNDWFQVQGVLYLVVTNNPETGTPQCLPMPTLIGVNITPGGIATPYNLTQNPSLQNLTWLRVR
jgi:hypothetical protein